VPPNERPSGATSRPRAGAFIHGQRPWLSAAGVKVRGHPVRTEPAPGLAGESSGEGDTVLIDRML